MTPLETSKTMEDKTRCWNCSIPEKQYNLVKNTVGNDCMEMDEITKGVVHKTVKKLAKILKYIF